MCCGVLAAGYWAHKTRTLSANKPKMAPVCRYIVGTSPLQNINMICNTEDGNENPHMNPSVSQFPSS